MIKIHKAAIRRVKSNSELCSVYLEAQTPGLNPDRSENTSRPQCCRCLKHTSKEDVNLTNDPSQSEQTIKATLNCFLKEFAQSIDLFQSGNSTPIEIVSCAKRYAIPLLDSAAPLQIAALVLIRSLLLTARHEFELAVGCTIFFVKDAFKMNTSLFE